MNINIQDYYYDIDGLTLQNISSDEIQKGDLIYVEEAVLDRNPSQWAWGRNNVAVLGERQFLAYVRGINHIEDKDGEPHPNPHRNILITVIWSEGFDAQEDGIKTHRKSFKLDSGYAVISKAVIKQGAEKKKKVELPVTQEVCVIDLDDEIPF